MDNEIIKIREKIVVENPPVAPGNNGGVVSLEFAKAMGNFEYIVADNDIILTKVTKGSSFLTIPMGVTIIGDGAFSGVHVENLDTKIKSIFIPSSVYEIREAAFAGNKYLESVSMEKSSVLTIGKNAFAGCSKLYHINLPKCLNEIGMYAFRNTALKEIFVPRHTEIAETVFDDNTMYLRGDSAYRDILIEEYKKTVLRPREIEKEKAAFIEKQEQRKQKAVDGLDSMKDAYKMEFRRNKEKELTEKEFKYKYIDSEVIISERGLKDSIKKYHSLLYLVMNDKLDKWDLVFPGGYNESEFCKKIFAKIDKNISVVSCNYTDKEIKAKLKEIEDNNYTLDESGNAINIVKTLDKIQFMDSCLCLGQDFADKITPNISYLRFKNIIPILNFDVKYLDNITTLEIESTKDISKDELSKFKNLKELKIRSYSKVTLTPSIFESLQKLEKLLMDSGNGEVYIESGALKELPNLESVILEDAVAIGESAFENCKKLKSVILRKLKQIGARAFAGCESLETIDLSKCKELKISKGAFSGCKNLKKVTLHKTAVVEDEMVKNVIVSMEAAKRAKTLKAENIEKKEDTQVVQNLPNLAEIKTNAKIIDEQDGKLIVCKSKRVEIVGEYEFDKLPKQFFDAIKKCNTLVFHGTLPKWHSDNYKYFKSIKNLIIRDVSKILHDNVSAFTFAENVEITNCGKIEIAYDCFGYRNKLKSVDIRTGVGGVLIDEEAFFRNLALKKFNFDDVESIGEKAFAYCPKLKCKKLPSNIKVAKDAFLK